MYVHTYVRSYVCMYIHITCMYVYERIEVVYEMVEVGIGCVLFSYYRWRGPRESCKI